MLLSFPISKMRILDLLRFERVSSLFSASFLFASFLLCFSALLFFSSHPTMTPSFHLPFASRIASPSESLPSSLLLLSALGYFSLFFFLLFGHVVGSPVVGRSDFDSRVRCREFVGCLAAPLWAKLRHCRSSTCRRNRYEILMKSWG